MFEFDFKAKITCHQQIFDVLVKRYFFEGMKRKKCDTT